MNLRLNHLKGNFIVGYSKEETMHIEELNDQILQAKLNKLMAVKRLRKE